MTELMRQEQLSLLQEIIQNPEDDDIRLVYADYLEDTSNLESERTRANLIRTQIYESRGEVRKPNSDELIFKYERSWRSRLWPLLLTSSETNFWKVHIKLVRGFISHIGLTHDTFLMEKLAGVLFSFEPIDSVSLIDRITHIHSGRHNYLPITEKNKYALFNYNIDPRLFNLFKAKIRLTYGGTRYETKGEFDSLEEANKALSDACVTYGRNEANKYLDERIKLTTTG